MKTCVFYLSFLLLLSSCATLSPAAKKLKIIDPVQLNELSSCKDLGLVEEKSSSGRKRLIIRVRNSAAKMGGNVVVSKLTPERLKGEEEKLHGRVFDCPEYVMPVLHDSEDF